MSQVDFQYMMKNEVTFGTPVVVDHPFAPASGFDIDPVYGRTFTETLRPAQWVDRYDRVTPYLDHGEGHGDFPVLSKSFGYWLKHLMGSVATTGPAETTVYTHTGTTGDLIGSGFTAQTGKPFNPSGTVQPFTWGGCKVPKFTLSNSPDGDLMLGVDIWAQSLLTATGLATPSWTAGMETMSWIGGTVSIGGSQYDIIDISIEVDNGLVLGRKQIRASSATKEPTGGKRTISFTINADFDSLTQFNRANALTVAGIEAQIIASWQSPTLLGSTLFPGLVATIDIARFDDWTAPVSGPTGITQTLSGVGTLNTNSALTLAYRTADTTP